MKLLKLLDEYKAIETKIFEYFNLSNAYGEIDDVTEYYWYANDHNILYALTKEEIDIGEAAYSNEILNKKSYKGQDYTMFYVHNGCGDYFYQIFDNAKEVKNE